jgi:hypothetical protein
MNRRVLQVSRAISRRLVKEGAKAVVLVGNHVRGDAYKESDLDIHAIGKGWHCRLERYQGFLVSTSWATVRQIRQSFKNPEMVGGVIPAWRNIIIIHDPGGIAKAFKNAAQEWS